MKTTENRAIRVVTVFLLAAFLLITMTSCSSSIEGTYKATTYDNESIVLIFTESTYQFSWYDANGNYVEEVSEYGNYTIEGDSITFSPLGGTPYICTFEKDGNDLLIDGGFYEKQ